MIEEKIQTRIPKIPGSERELMECSEGDLVKVKIFSDAEPVFFTYALEDRFSQIYSCFLERSKINPNYINVWKSYIKHLQFDEKEGVIFNELNRNLERLTPQHENFCKYSQLLKNSGMWEEGK